MSDDGGFETLATPAFMPLLASGDVQNGAASN